MDENLQCMYVEILNYASFITEYNVCLGGEVHIKLRFPNGRIGWYYLDPIGK